LQTKRQATAAAPPEPLVTVTHGGKGLCVEAVNAAAAAIGLAPGQPLADARALEAGIRVRNADPAADAAALVRLAAWCRRWSPWTASAGLETAGAGGLWLDVTGCAHLFGGESEMLADLVARLAALGHDARAGLADTAGAAWALARHAADAAKPTAIAGPGDQRAALAPLPVACLRLPAKAVEDFHRLG